MSKSTMLDSIGYYLGGHIGRGNYYLKKDEYDKALECFSSSIKNSPVLFRHISEVIAYNNRGYTYLVGHKNYDKAKEVM